jgi:hypothetical protein
MTKEKLTRGGLAKSKVCLREAGIASRGDLDWESKERVMGLGPEYQLLKERLMPETRGII